METVRWFAPDVEKIAPEWRETVIHSGDWTKVEAEIGFAHGEAQGFFVNCGTLDGYAKAGTANHYRAAHEKISSDLAFELKLPVPPAVLNEAHGNCSVSAIAFPGPQKWGVAQSAPNSVQTMIPRLSAASSAMTVFDTWVANSDRHNGGNLVVSLASINAPGIAYIDYGNSLSHSWQAGPAPETPAIIDRFPSDVGSLVPAVVLGTLERIEKLSEDVLRNIVERIPEAFLPKDWGAAVAIGLLNRRCNLRPLFETHCGGSR